MKVFNEVGKMNIVGEGNSLLDQETIMKGRVKIHGEWCKNNVEDKGLLMAGKTCL